MKNSGCYHQNQVNQSAPGSNCTVLTPHQAATALLLQRLNQIILTSSESNLLQQMAQAIGETCKVDSCLIATTGADLAQTGYWKVPSQPFESSQSQILALRHLTSRVMLETTLLAIDDLQAIEDPELMEWGLIPSARAVLKLPLWFQGKMYGEMLLIRTKPCQWTELEKSRALVVAPAVAIAVVQVGQTKVMTNLQQQIHRFSEYQTLTNHLFLASQNLELQEIIQTAITQTTQTLKTDRGMLVQLKYTAPVSSNERRSRLLQAKATVICEWNPQHDNTSVLAKSFWLSECDICQQALIDAPKPTIVTDLDTVTSINPTRESPLFKSSVGLLLFPLLNQDTVLGFIVLEHSTPRQWEPEELALLELVGVQLSNAMIQHQTRQQVQALLEERTVQLQSSLAIQAHLYDKTRQQMNQLRQLNQLKDEFINNVNHELRTPLTSMSIAIRLLRQPGLTTENRTKYLDILEQQCSQEIKLVNDLLRLQELQSNQEPLKIEPINLKLKIWQLVQSFEKIWLDKGLKIQLDVPQTSLLVKTEVDSLDRILQELFANAGKHSDSNTTIVLKVDEQAEQIIFRLTNIGSISPEEATHIFDKFRRGSGVTQKAIQGTGLGLALVKCLVQHLNGTINLSTHPISHSSLSEICFTLTLPKFFELQS